MPETDEDEFYTTTELNYDIKLCCLMFSIKIRFCEHDYTLHFVYNTSECVFHFENTILYLSASNILLCYIMLGDINNNGKKITVSREVQIRIEIHN